MTQRRARILAAGAVLAGVVLAVILLVAESLPPARPDYVPADPALRRPWLYLYAPRSLRDPPRALVIFFGNDVGFWAAHQTLAADLASRDYAVVGVDVKPLIESLPPGDAAAAADARDSIFAAHVDTLVRASRDELHLQGRPVILLGHSLGAELAVWTAHHVAIPGLRGVVALSPAARGHLKITLRDLANVSDPHEPGSFSVADLAASLPPALRIALVRGDRDRLRAADSAIVAQGGRRLRYWSIPMAGHSLKRVLVARYVVRAAVDWVAAAPRGTGVTRRLDAPATRR